MPRDRWARTAAGTAVAAAEPDRTAYSWWNSVGDVAPTVRSGQPHVKATCGTWGARAPHGGLLACDRHLLDEPRPRQDMRAAVHVVADSDQVRVHVAEVGGDRDLLDRIGDLAVFHPEARGTAGIVAGDDRHTLPHHFRHQQARAELAQHAGEVVVTRLHKQVVHAASVAGGRQAQLAGRIAAQDVTLEHAIHHQRRIQRGHAFGVEYGRGQPAWNQRLFVQAEP